MSGIGTTMALAAVGLSLALGNASKEETHMSFRAKGTFAVKMTPATPVTPGAASAGDSVAAARFTFDKTFDGDLVGTSKGEMWTADTSVPGSAGYVAIERVSATLQGRSGSFTVLHQGTMKSGGGFHLGLVLVPDSGTGALTGIGGTMSIVIEGGKHFYELDYTLAGSDPISVL